MNTPIGSFLAKHRELSGFSSQRRLATKSTISAATISRIELGEQKPNIETLKQLAKYLHTTSFVELMLVSQYMDPSEDIIIPLEEILLNKYSLSLDGQRLTQDEIEFIVHLIRGYRPLLKKFIENNS